MSCPVSTQIARNDCLAVSSELYTDSQLDLASHLLIRAGVGVALLNYSVVNKEKKLGGMSNWGGRGGGYVEFGSFCNLSRNTVYGEALEWRVYDTYITDVSFKKNTFMSVDHFVTSFSNPFSQMIF